MTRWISVLAMLLVIAMVANTECYARCVVSAPHNAAMQTRCCPDHSPAKSRSSSDCQHRYPDLKNAELATDVWKPVPGGTIAAVADVTIVASFLPTRSRSWQDAVPLKSSPTTVLRI